MSLITNTFLSSDLVIMDTLRASTDEFISNCNLYYINQSMASDTTNSIYVGGVNSTKFRENTEGEEFHNLITIYINTKHTNYEHGSKYLRTVCEHIISELYNNPLLVMRNIKTKSITYDYGTKFNIKGLHLIVECNELRRFIKTETVASVEYNRVANYKQASLLVTVADKDRNPVKEAVVLVTNKENEKIRGVTDEAGHCLFEEIPLNMTFVSAIKDDKVNGAPLKLINGSNAVEIQYD